MTSPDYYLVIVVIAMVQVSELQRLRREEARRTAEIEEALAAVRNDDAIVEGREAALRAELEEVRRQHAERQVSTGFSFLILFSLSNGIEHGIET